MPGQASPTCRLHAHSQGPQPGYLAVPTSPCPSRALSTCCMRSTQSSLPSLPPETLACLALQGSQERPRPGFPQSSRLPHQRPIVYPHVCRHTHILTCAHMHAHTFIYSHTPVLTCMYTHSPVLTCTHTNSHTLCSHACTHSYTCAYMHVHT